MECQQEIETCRKPLKNSRSGWNIFWNTKDRTEVDRLMLVNLVKRIEVYASRSALSFIFGLKMVKRRWDCWKQ